MTNEYEIGPEREARIDASLNARLLARRIGMIENEWRIITATTLTFQQWIRDGRDIAD